MVISVYIHKVTQLVLILVVGILISGCSTTSDKRFTLIYPETTQTLYYPDAPQPARYQYIGDLVGEKNFPEILSKKQGFWMRFMSSLTGYGVEPAKTLKRPVNGLTMSDDTILIADAGLHGIFKFSPSENQFEIWKKANRQISFVNPVGLAEGDNLQVFISDAGLGEIFLLSSQGDLIRQFGKGLLTRPAGIAYHQQSQQLFVVDTQAHQVLVFNAQGELLDRIGQHGDRHQYIDLNHPTFIALKDNILYITDTMNASVVSSSLDGDFLNRFGKRGYHMGNFNRPKGVAVDSQNNLYVVESYFDFLLVYNGQGQLLLPIGGTGNDPGQFYLPSGVWVDEQDRIFIADMANGRVSVFQYLATHDE